MAKTRKKRGRYRFFMAIFIMVALVFVFYLTSGLFFKITNVRVEGISVYTQEEIQRESGIAAGENIFMINKMSAARTIIGRFPYVERVRIRRELPGTVVIEITESTPVALLAHKEEYWIINLKGTLLEMVTPAHAPPLTQIQGAELSAPVLGNSMHLTEADLSKREPLLELLNLFAQQDMLEDIGALDITYISNIVFTYTDRFSVELGFPEHLETKLAFLLESIPKLDESNPNGRGRFYLEDAHTDNRVRFVPE